MTDNPYLMGAFSTQNWKLRMARWVAQLRYPAEDHVSFNLGRDLIAAVDGVTRDPCEYLPDMSTLRGKLHFLSHYPKPSPAAEAAHWTAQTLSMNLPFSDSIGEHSISDLFEQANVRVASYNRAHNLIGPHVDYLTRDFAGCVASCAQLSEDTVRWGFIADCGVAVFSRNGDRMFRTEEESPHRLDDYVAPRCEKACHTSDWRHPAVRRFWRERIRNKPTDQEHSYGVLTGEDEALPYVRTGHFPLRKDDSVLVYTDGAADVLFQEDRDVRGNVADMIRDREWPALRRHLRENVHSEGSIAYMVFPGL